MIDIHITVNVYFILVYLAEQQSVEKIHFTTGSSVKLRIHTISSVSNTQLNLFCSATLDLLFNCEHESVDKVSYWSRIMNMFWCVQLVV